METSGCASDDLCQAFSDVLLNIKDVDADDYDNPMLCSEYVKDIYLYLRQLEVWRKYALLVCYYADLYGKVSFFFFVSLVDRASC